MTVRKLGAHVAFLIGLASLAALSRYTLTFTESRWQIAAFWLVVVCAEWYVKPRVGIKPQWLLALSTCACTTGAIILVRWHIKGLCPHTWPQCPSPMAGVLHSLGV
jgi:hypothetical protein